MVTLSLSTDGLERCVSETARILRHPGAVVLVPTETVYGLIAQAGDSVAAARIFQLKHRPSNKVLGCFAPSAESLTEFGAELSGLPSELISRYAPGPLTVIAPLKSGGTIGFRLPDHPFLAALLKELPVLLVQTSANRSGASNPLSVPEALAQLDGEPDLAVNGGDISAGALASTVVDATGSEIKILRQGSLKL